MPTYFSENEVSKFKKIRKRLISSGKPEDKASEIAARIVNKDRRKKGKTQNKTTMGTGNPNKKLESRNKNELYNRARQLKIKNRSKMNKAQLVEAIRNIW